MMDSVRMIGIQVDKSLKSRSPWAFITFDLKNIMDHYNTAEQDIENDYYKMYKAGKHVYHDYNMPLALTTITLKMKEEDICFADGIVSYVEEKEL